MKCLVIGKKQLISIGSVLLIILFAALCALGVLAQRTGARPIRRVERGDTRLSVTFTARGQAETGEILSALQKYNVKATFFVTADWAAAHAGQVKALSDAGQELGCLIENTGNTEEALLALDTCRRQIAEAGGAASSVYRTADGEWSSALLGEEAAGLPISWSVDGGDGELDSTVQKIADNVLTAAGPGKIIRLDCSGKYTAGVLPYILEGLIAKGYEPAALQSLLLPPPYMVDGEGCQRPAE